jgi:hypothetical protein
MRDACLYQRLIEKLDRPEGDHCWEWRGFKDRKGYGRHYSGSGKTLMAHRAMWTALHGEIPAGKVICHRCDNPSCSRPDHLFVGTTQDNADDREAKGRGIPFGRRNARDKLDNRDVANEMWERANTIDDHDFQFLNIPGTSKAYSLG